MARYIDADKLTDKLEELQFNAPVMTPVMKIYNVIELVEDQPTADVVEVVRCKDCEHNADNGGDCDRVLIHTHRNLVTEMNEYLCFKLNFCEYGTPKERGGEK